MGLGERERFSLGGVQGKEDPEEKEMRLVILVVEAWTMGQQQASTRSL